jgi:hypothetical protein
VIGVAYVLSVLVRAVGLSAVAVWGSRLARPGATRLLDLVCAALMALWGAQLIARGAGVLT